MLRGSPVPLTQRAGELPISTVRPPASGHVLCLLSLFLASTYPFHASKGASIPIKMSQTTSAPPTTTTNAKFLGLDIGCPAIVPGIKTSYGYTPSEAAGIIFIILFTFSMLGHLFMSIRKRERATAIVLAVGCLSKSLPDTLSSFSASFPHPPLPFLSLTPSHSPSFFFFSRNPRLGWPPLVFPMPLQQRCLPDANHDPHHRSDLL